MVDLPDGTQVAKEFGLLGVPSAILFGLIHEGFHRILGVEPNAIALISILLGSLGIVGYVVNQELLDREVELYQVILTGLALLVGHLGLHFVLGFPAVLGVGTGVVVLTAVGYLLNYL